MRDKRGLALAAALVAIAGSVDATGYLYFAHFFVSFMSGNSTMLGIDLALGRWQTAGPILLALVSFVFGSFMGGLADAAAWNWHTPLVLAFEATLLALALASSLAADQRFLSIAALAAAMGAQNAVLHRVGGANVSLTFVTGTLIRLGRSLADAVLGRSGRRLWLVYAALWAALCVGALTGALLYRAVGFTALAAPAVALFVIGIIETRRGFRNQRPS